jgi:hypothetical protein
VREDYRELLGEGYEGEEATRLLLEDHAEVLDDPDDAPDLWLALAATQWKVGRLEDEVRRRAIELIDSGADLRRWCDLEGSPADLKRRETALAKLREQLEGPARPVARIRRRPKVTTEFEVGDVLTYQLAAGRRVAFRVLELESDRGGTAPLIGLLDWMGPERPPEPLDSLPLREGRLAGEIFAATYLVYPENTRDYPGERVEIIRRGLPRLEAWSDAHLVWWSELRRADRDALRVASRSG